MSKMSSVLVFWVSMEEESRIVDTTLNWQVVYKMNQPYESCNICTITIGFNRLRLVKTELLLLKTSILSLVVLNYKL